MYNILSPSSSAVERLFPRGAAILTPKMSWLKVKKLLTACFSEGKLRLFEMQRVAQDDFDDMPTTFSR